MDKSASLEDSLRGGALRPYAETKPYVENAMTDFTPEPTNATPPVLDGSTYAGHGASRRR